MENSHISLLIGARLNARDALEGIINIAGIMKSDIENGDMDGDDIALKQKLCDLEDDLNKISDGVDLERSTLLKLREQAEQKLEYQKQHLKNIEEEIRMRGFDA